MQTVTQGQTMRLTTLLVALLMSTTIHSLPTNTASLIVAGGCFWCVEADFDKAPGVLTTTSGYTGGQTAHPTYEQVSTGQTGHIEAVEITYDPAKTNYRTLIDYFWRHVDPTDAGGQFCDRGTTYRTMIYYTDTAEQQDALASKAAAEAVLGQVIVTEIMPRQTFYPAEDYHQEYYLKNPVRYNFYRWRCGRDDKIEALWAK